MNIETKRKNRLKEFLGIDPGTARNRLVKMILFSYVKRVENNYCYVCSLEITSHETMTIEHKLPWEGRENGVALFWDLENIAFSHSWCNRPHINNPGTPRKIGPEGTSWCPDCQDFLPLDRFYKHKASRHTGVKTYCKTHDSLRDYRRNPRT